MRTPPPSPTIELPDSLNKFRYNLKFWIIVNVVLTFILLIGHVVILGAMQQVYSRMIIIQKTHNEYVKNYTEALEATKSSKKEPIPVVIIKK